MKQAQLLSITLLLSCASASYASDRTEEQLKQLVRIAPMLRETTDQVSCFINKASILAAKIIENGCKRPDIKDPATCEILIQQYDALGKEAQTILEQKFEEIQKMFPENALLLAATQSEKPASKTTDLATFVAQKPVAPGVTAPAAGLAVNKEEAKTE